MVSNTTQQPPHLHPFPATHCLFIVYPSPKLEAVVAGSNLSGQDKYATSGVSTIANRYLKSDNRTQ
jgi:hypothetical protein